MMSPRATKTRRQGARRRAVWAALVVAGGLVPSIGCQVEYAGMTLPSGKYLHDDVQYFAPGPDFPWANTNAATQRARMRAMGMDVSAIPVPGNGGAFTPPVAEGALDPTQNRPNAPTNVNSQLVPPGGEIVTPPPAPGVAPPAPGGPGAPGPMLPGGVGAGTVGPGY